MRHATDALAISRAIKDLLRETNLLSNITSYLIALERYDDAWNTALEALHLAYDLQLEVHVTWAVQHCAAVVALQAQEFANASEQYRGAAHLLGFVEKSLVVLEVVGWYTEVQEYDRVLDILRDRMGIDELANLMATGAAMTQDQVVEYALSIKELRVPERALSLRRFSASESPLVRGNVP